MIMVYVQYKDRPDVCGTAFARSWEELSRVIDKIFGDPCLCRIAPHEGYGAVCVQTEWVKKEGFLEPRWESLTEIIGPDEAYNLTPLDTNGFFEMDWDYVRSHNKPPVHLDKIFRLSGDSTKI